MATDNGLITPIIYSAQNLGLSKISNKVKALAEKARAGKLTPPEYQVSGIIYMIGRNFLYL